MLLVPVRQYILSRFFKWAHLQDLDAAEYEEAPAVNYNMSFQVSSAKLFIELVLYIYLYMILEFFHRYFMLRAAYGQEQDIEGRTGNIDGREILDEIITRNRGEIRKTHSPKATSSTQTPFEGIRPASAYSPRTAFSPWLSERRPSPSPGLNGKGIEEKCSYSPGPSNLGRSPQGPS